ncbi:MAG: LysR substrate-binding domain-containing protein [Pseudomonadota bacterium]
MTPDPDLRARFLAGMSHAAATVNVVTTDGAAGRVGVTVSAMSSVSADTPRPTLLVCIHQDSPAAAAILENGVFCVNVLRDDQSYISDTFAGRFREQVEDKFDCADWAVMPSGAPRAVDPLVAFDCRVVSTDLVGTHHVVFGEVGEVFISDHGSPLIYARRAYGAAARIDTPTTIDAGRAAEGNRLRIACFFTISAFTLPPLFRRLRERHGAVDITLIEGDQSRIQAALAAGEADIALMYDENIPVGLETEVLVERAPYVLVPEGHPLAAQRVVAAADLDGAPMVLLTTPPAPDYFLALLRDQGVEPQIAYRSGTIETVRGLVANGLGYALLASHPASDLSYDGRRLVTRPLGWAAKPSRVMLVRRGGAALPAPAAAFAALCREHFQTTDKTEDEAHGS